MDAFNQLHNGATPWLAALLVVGIVWFGYRELKVGPNDTAGLTTWVLAAAPFVGVLLWLLTWDVLHLTIRIALAGTLIAGAWKALSGLYRRAVESRNTRTGARDDAT